MDPVSMLQQVLAQGKAWQHPPQRVVGVGPGVRAVAAVPVSPHLTWALVTDTGATGEARYRCCAFNPATGTVYSGTQSQWTNDDRVRGLVRGAVQQLSAYQHPEFIGMIDHGGGGLKF